ncbi:MAG: hypothetical protein COA79_09555 [Planctomycetota bacterium]|nr:MAG: hypothetical protein COA79_09555 [Planctomycetota bacterium]
MLAQKGIGRVVINLADQIKEQIANDKKEKGDFLPSVRSLSEIYRVSTKTVHRSLQLLATKGCITSLPRQGYQVVETLNSSNGIFAFLTNYSFENNEPYENIEKLIYLSLQKEAYKRGWSILIIPSRINNIHELNKQLKDSNVTGVIVNDTEWLNHNQLNDLIIPAISLDVWNQYKDVNEIARDEYQGASQAAIYLIEKGHNEFIWVGPIKDNINGTARFGSAYSTLIKNNFDLSAKNRFDFKTNQFNIEDAKKILKKIKTPVGIFVLWREMSMTMIRAAKELNMNVGEDFDLVGWSTTEEFHTNYANDIPELATKCGNALWSIENLCYIILNRIEELKRKPQQKSYRISVPMEFRNPDN